MTPNWELCTRVTFQLLPYLEMAWMLQHRNSISARWSFDVGEKVHPASWGHRRRNSSSKTHTAARAHDPHHRWTSSDFNIQDKIGAGYFGVVVQAELTREDRDDSQIGYNGIGTVALKTFSKAKLISRQRQGKKAIELLQREVNIQSHLDHPHITRLLGFFEDPIRFNMVLELAEKGDVFQYMFRLSGKHRLRSARTIVWQVCQALAYLECVQVAHRDIKPENLLVMGGVENVQVKLGDFGWAVWYRPGCARHTTMCGTAEYIPPELLATPVRYMADYVDVWMLGVLMIELHEGVTPFRPDDYSAPESFIFRSIRSFRSVNQLSLLPNANYQDLVSCLLCRDPSRRMSATEATNHPYFAKMKGIQPPTSPTVAQRQQLFQQT